MSAHDAALDDGDHRGGRTIEGSLQIIHRARVATWR
jgi:hypothetical protein